MVRSKASMIQSCNSLYLLHLGAFQGSSSAPEREIGSTVGVSAYIFVLIADCNLQSRLRVTVWEFSE